MADTVNKEVGKEFPGYSEDAYPELFDIRAMLPQPSTLKPGQQPERIIKEFFEKGFIIIENFFLEDELQPVRDAINEIVDDTAHKLNNAGKISDLYKDYGFTKRLTKLETEFPDANVIALKMSRKGMKKPFKDLWTNERLLNLVEQIIGPDIAGNPVWSLRTKVPHNDIVTVPLHQDSAYMDNDSYKLLIPTAWIPLIDANKENGCMEVGEEIVVESKQEFFEGGHRAGKIARHKGCWKDTFYIYLEEEEMKRTLDEIAEPHPDMNIKVAAFTVCEKPQYTETCKNGKQQTPFHFSLFITAENFSNLPNISDGIRWSLDLRWQKDGTPGCIWGKKDTVTMRRASDPNYQVDCSALIADFKGEGLDDDEDEFDTTLHGPPMKQWEMVHTNREACPGPPKTSVNPYPYMSTYVPGYSEDAFPELFDTRAMLPQPSMLKPGQQPEKLIKEYFEKGIIVIDDFFREDELQPVRDAINEIVDDTAQKLYNAGKITDLYKEYGFTKRLAKLETEFPDANMIAMKASQDGMKRAFKDIWTNERLLNLVEQIIGPDIAGNPVWNLRTKVPQNEITTVPWHQDSAYLDTDSYKFLIPTAWIPLVDANKENGCMEFIEGGHRTGRIARHKGCWKDTFFIYLEEEEMKRTLGVDPDQDRRLCEIRSGSLLFFNNIIPHRSLPNVSNGIRWSLDLRWQKDGAPGCLWGMKEGVTMRRACDPNYQIDWTHTDSVNRNSVQTVYMKGEELDAKEEEFDTTIQGPWMKQWEMVHTNRHVERFMHEEKAKSQH